jgi:outer membrane protein OmpA-like peptidoglycan-associated protein
VDGKGNEVSGVQWNVGDQSGSNGDTFTWQVMEGNHANVIASAEGFKEHTYNVEVMNVDNTEATVTMVADVGTLLVKAVDEEGNPINAGWIVKGKKPFVKLAGEAHKMAIGDFNIQVRAKGFKPVTKKATIQAGSETVIEVTMKKSLANVDGNKISIDDSVYFATGSHVILEKSHKLLDDVAHILDEHPSITKLEIEGHTDSQGKDSANKALSQMRADAVKEYLISKGIGESRLHSIGYGEEKPIASNDTEEGRAQNRRVHFHIAEQDHSKEEH